MRQFIVTWKMLDRTRRSGVQIVNLADDFVICGRALAAAMRAVVERMMERLALVRRIEPLRCCGIESDRTVASR